jgi:hypothetical protein
MRKVINGILYSPLDALHIGFFKCGWRVTYLYVKPDGEFFIYEVFDKFLPSAGCEIIIQSRRIIPKSFAEAREWCAMHVSPEEFNKYFEE